MERNHGKAHLVGSVNLADAEEVFRTVGAVAGGSLARVPDGERGRRNGWIGAQVPVLMGSPRLDHEELPPGQYGAPGPRIVFRPKAGVAPGDIDLAFPYGEDAVAAHRLLRALIADGVLPRGTKLQVSIPTAIATVVAYFAPESQQAMLPRIEELLGREVRRIVDTVPHDEVAIQWDVAVEFNYIELMGTPGPFTRDDLIAGLVRLSALVPGTIDLGYHLCYGDAPKEPGGKGRHFVEPADTGLLVTFANGVSAGAARPIRFIHMPVPIERDDAGYFAPLAGLALGAQTGLYLGLVHEEDGLEGARRRVAAAAEYVTGFGVATECGLGNEQPDAIRRILAIQRDIELPGVPA